jgi:hypothetical protein
MIEDGKRKQTRISRCQNTARDLQPRHVGMAKKGINHPQHKTELDRLVKIELEIINGKLFYSQATDDELLNI